MKLKRYKYFLNENDNVKRSTSGMAKFGIDVTLDMYRKYFDENDKYETANPHAKHFKEFYIIYESEVEKTRRFRIRENRNIFDNNKYLGIVISDDPFNVSEPIKSIEDAENFIEKRLKESDGFDTTNGDGNAVRFIKWNIEDQCIEGEYWDKNEWTYISWDINGKNTSGQWQSLDITGNNDKINSFINLIRKRLREKHID